MNKQIRWGCGHVMYKGGWGRYSRALVHQYSYSCVHTLWPWESFQPFHFHITSLLYTHNDCREDITNHILCHAVIVDVNCFVCLLTCSLPVLIIMIQSMLINWTIFVTPHTRITHVCMWSICSGRTMSLWGLPLAPRPLTSLSSPWRKERKTTKWPSLVITEQRYLQKH